MAKTMTRRRPRPPATSVQQLVRDREVEDRALKRVEEMERERAERSRAEERERAPLIEHAWEMLGEPGADRLSEAERADAKPPRRAPWWAESIGLSEAEARELSAVGPLYESEPVKVSR